MTILALLCVGVYILYRFDEQDKEDRIKKIIDQMKK